MFLCLNFKYHLIPNPGYKKVATFEKEVKNRYTIYAFFFDWYRHHHNVNLTGILIL